MLSEGANMVDDPLSFAIKSVITLNTPVGKLVAQMTRDPVPRMSTLLRNIHDDTIAHSTATRCIVYRSIDSHLLVSDVYTKSHTINDMRKMSFTRFRVCGHSLPVETGRPNWRGRGRLPWSSVCGRVAQFKQNKQHVVETCPHTGHLRDIHPWL